MNEMPFPKPSPADPLPLETWLRRTDRSEVGREPFFRGRDADSGCTVPPSQVSAKGSSVAERWSSRAVRTWRCREETVWRRLMGWRVIPDGPDAPDLELELFLKSFTEMETPGDGG